MKKLSLLFVLLPELVKLEPIKVPTRHCNDKKLDINGIPKFDTEN